MTPDRWRQIEELYHSARERALADRAALLAQADPELRREVEAMLAQDASDGKILDRPAEDLLTNSRSTMVAPGSQLGPYQIEALLGAGGMGEVYRAVDTRLNRKVAVKISMEQFSERFEREARAIAALNHPHICTLHDVGPNYLVMELVEGETLAAKLKKGKLSIHDTLRYGAQIADALAAAHSKGITHRDLKPGNVMVAKNGVKVLDFGLAKSAGDETLTVGQAIMGTPAYMAPEQSEGKECDARTDIYALGLMLREMTPDLPPHLAHVVERCLANDPGERWQAASDVRRELEWAATSPATRSPAPLTRSPAPLGWIVAGALLIALGIVSFFSFRPAPLRPLIHVDAEIPADTPLARGGNGGGMLALSPDGTRLALILRGADGKVHLYTRLLDQNQITPLTGTENAAFPFFSPDGQWIGFFADGKLKKISVEGGTAIALCDAPTPRGASWGDDGNIIANLTNVGGLSRVPAIGGTPVPVTKLNAGELSHRLPHVLPGSQAVLFTASTQPVSLDYANIDVVSLKTGERKTVQRGGFSPSYLATTNRTGHLVYLRQTTLFAVPFDPGRLALTGEPRPILEDVGNGTTSGVFAFAGTPSGPGTFVYVARKAMQKGWPISWLDSAGKSKPLHAQPGDYRVPRFSPDGKRLAFSMGNREGLDIWVKDLDRDNPYRLSFLAGLNSWPVWTTDGKNIVFTSTNPTASGLYWIHSDGSGEAQLLADGKLSEAPYSFLPYSFSPDGKRLAFAGNVNGSSRGIFTARIEGDASHPRLGKPELFLRNGAYPAFSPDGRWLAYASNEAATAEVYVRPFPGAGGRWQTSTGGGSYPLWSRDGRELVFEAPDGRVMAVSYTAKGDSFAADKPRVWSETRLRNIGVASMYDLAPDGKRLAAILTDDEAPTHLTFLLNFFDELRREVEAMLAQDASDGKILDRPAEDLLINSRTTLVAPGSQLGPYQIEALLGAGGMGEVYRAVDTRLKRTVAIKVAKENFSERFEREARAIAALNHPNICTLYDVGPNYLVMELIEGPTLAERIHQGPVPLEEALGIARQIADALEAAHEKGVVHRDLKPGNVKIKPDGIVKVLDFGLAKVAPVLAHDSPAEATATLTTRAGMIMGTAAYMSPEQAQGKPVDKRADIWAFGVVLYEMLTGRRMFQGETVSDTLAAVLTKEPELERVPTPMRRLLKRCLEKDPQKRLRDISGVGLLLEDVGQVHDLPIRPAMGRSHLPWAVAALAVVVALALGWIAWRATRRADRPLMRFSADLGPEAVEGFNITAAISPDGARLAFVARGPGGKEELATRLLDQAKATLLPGTENAADPFFSPDGQWIGFFADGKMKKISVEGGAAVTLCDAPGPRGASWSEDGSIIVTLKATIGVGVSRVPAAGGTPQPITKPSETGEATHRWPQVLPGGQAVLFTGHTIIADYDDASIEVLSLKTGQWKIVQPGGYFARYLPTSNGAGHLVYLHQGRLFAVGFDLDQLEVRGTPVPVLEDVAGNAAAGGGQYDVARNGTLVYLSGKSSGASWPIAWLDRTGKTEPLLAAPGQYYMPRFSPDGKRLALVVRSAAGDDIQVYDWQRDTMTRLTFAQGNQNRSPVWTPDATHIIFQFVYPGGNSIRWVRADGAGQAQTLLESRVGWAPYSFSPDGRRLAYSFPGSVDTGSGLWTLPLDVSDPEHPKPGEPELFLRTPFNEQDPAFSPDGRWIAYTSTESGRSEVYVRPFRGGAPSGSGKWQISTAGGAYPIWSRNGRELFYEASNNRIMVSTYTAEGDSFAQDKPRPWSNTQIFDPIPGLWNLDLAPDGKRFAVTPRSESGGEQKGSVHVTVLLNFFDELRRRVPARSK